jgi:hypothetical protein
MRLISSLVFRTKAAAAFVVGMELLNASGVTSFS